MVVVGVEGKHQDLARAEPVNTKFLQDPVRSSQVIKTFAETESKVWPGLQ